MQWYFCNSVDIKLLLHDIESLDSGQGLNRLADQFQVGRVGTAHQAGSDSLVTLDLFFKMTAQFFSKNINYVFQEYTRKIYGFGELDIQDQFQLQNKQYPPSAYQASQSADHSQVSSTHLSHPTTPTLTPQSVAFQYAGTSQNQSGFMLSQHNGAYDYNQSGQYMYANTQNASTNSYYPHFPPPPVMNGTSLAQQVQIPSAQRYFPASGVKTSQQPDKRLPLLKQASNPFQSSLLVQLNAKSSPAFQPSKKFDNEAASLPQMNLPPSNQPRQY